MEEKKNFSNIIVASIFLIFSIWMIIYAIPKQVPITSVLGEAEETSITVNSRTTPYFASVIILGASLMLLIGSIIKYKRMNNYSGISIIKSVINKNELRALSILIVCIIYGVAFRFLGYILASAIVMPMTLLLLRDKVIMHYGIVYAVGLTLYLIFKFVLNIPIP